MLSEFWPAPGNPEPEGCNADTVIDFLREVETGTSASLVIFFMYLHGNAFSTIAPRLVFDESIAPTFCATIVSFPG